MSDWIIFLDTPLYLRKYWILLRYIKQKLRIEKCHYKSDLKMLKAMFWWTKEFEENRLEFEKMLKEYGSKLIVIKRPEELIDLQANFKINRKEDNKNAEVKTI